MTETENVTALRLQELYCQESLKCNGSIQIEVIDYELCPFNIKNRSLSTNSLNIDDIKQLTYGLVYIV